MSSITGWLVAFAFFAILLAILYVGAKMVKSKNKEISTLKSELEKQKQVSIELYKHSAEVSKIEKEKDETMQKISEAKTDEEVLDIINGIIDSNNDRVRK